MPAASPSTTPTTVATVAELRERFPKFRFNELGAQALEQLFAFARAEGLQQRLTECLSYAHDWGRADYIRLFSGCFYGSERNAKCLDFQPMRASPAGDQALYYMGMVWFDDEHNWSFHS